MKCHKCNKTMNYSKDLNFNGNKIEGWRCSCGEIYFESSNVQRVLLLNKLREEEIKAKLGRIKSNLILRLPKEVEIAFNLEKGETVIVKAEKDFIKIIPT